MNKTIITRDKASFLESLFKPINGKTADGYVSKRLKNRIVVWLAGKEYTVNAHKVWCNMTKLANGQTWYSHAVIDEHLNKYLGYMAQYEAASTLLAGESFIQS